MGDIPTTRLADGGFTVTVLTGASATVTEDVPVIVSLVAVIVTGPPAATAVTRPVVLTVAIALLLDDHVTPRPVSTLPFASLCYSGQLLRRRDSSTRLAEEGVTVTVLTGASVTVIEDVPVFVSLVAVIVVPPAPTAVTKAVRVDSRRAWIARSPRNRATQ